VSAVRYLELAAWPSGLAVLHPHPYLKVTGGTPLGAARVIGACLTLSALCYVLLGRWGRPWTRTGWLWYAVTLLPVIGLVQVGHQAYAERYAYVPLIGIYLIVAWSAGSLAERGEAWRNGAVVAALSVLLAFSIVARGQLQYWRDSTALFTRAVEISPESGVTHHNLAVAHLEAGRFDQAQRHFESAIDIEPRNPSYLNNLGRLHQRAGRPLEAIPYHRRAIAVGPRNAIGKNLLGEAYEAAGMLDQAIATYQAALEVRPNLESAARNLERARKRRGG
jgi:tetratricopeptide (TPR) repeat protein